MKTILPLSMPGVMSGIVMVFMPTVSTFAIAELLTMNNIKLFGTTVQENIYNGMWNYGSGAFPDYVVADRRYHPLYER